MSDEKSPSPIISYYVREIGPILPTAAPIQIADVEDVCVLVNGVWRYKSKRLTTLFAGGVPITLPS